MADNELASALGHRERAIAGSSQARMRQRTDPNVRYAHPYPELEKEYTREQCSRLEQLFAEADPEGDGFVTLDKLKRFSEKKMGRPVTHLDAKKIIALADEDQDKRLSLEEFMRLWLHVAAGKAPEGSGLDKVMDDNDIRPDISKNPNFTDSTNQAGSIKNRFEQLAISDEQQRQHDETIRQEHQKMRQQQREEAAAQQKLDQRKQAMKARGAMFEQG